MDTAMPDAVIPFTPIALYRLLGGPRSPLLLDVRKAPAFDADATTLPGALRVAPEAVAGWNPPSGAHTLVACCVHGHEVGRGAAAALCARGFRAGYLEGGIETWRELGLPTMAKRRDFGVPGDAPSRWVTREHPKIDRIACPWLVRRFIDPRAEFLYVPRNDVLDVAARERATAYDIAGAPLDHAGDACSFDAFIAAFGLVDPPLALLARIVRGADTGRPQLAPQSPGLVAISAGLSVNFPDDHAMLEHGIVMYDALYAWCRATCDAHQGVEPAAVSTA